MIPVILGLPREAAELFSLVLASQDIPHRLESTVDGWELHVPEHDYHASLNAIHLYVDENRETVPSSHSFPQRFHQTYSGLFVAAMMFAIHVKIPPGPYRNSIVEHYGSSASHVLDGELYRLVTALFLHGDDIHLSGNMGGILLFGTSVASLTGAGVGWFLILLSGILGNGINAWFFQSNHLSIGSSTAIFGAVGILAGLRFIHIYHEKGWHVSALLPLGAGLALLGLLGSSAHSDVTAHLFGYLSGLFSAIFYARITPKAPAERIQYAFHVLSAVIVISAWYTHRF